MTVTRPATRSMEGPDAEPPVALRESSAKAPWRELGGFLLVSLLVRLCVLVLDARPRFFLGDSESYLETAVGFWLPNDRSWMYGLLINALLRWSHTLKSIILLQTLASAALCASIAGFCRRVGVRSWIAWAALLVLSVEPMLLYYDRSIMTDAPGTVVVVVGIVLAASWMVRASWRALIGSAVCFWAAICLRTALLPLVFWVPAFVVTWAAVGAVRSGMRDAWRQRIAGPAALLAASAFGVIGYAFANGVATNSAPSLNPRGGAFMLGRIAPILAPEDFAGIGVANPAQLLEETRHADRRLRNWQVFGAQGLIPRLEEALGDSGKVSRAGALLVRRSIARDPLGFAELVCGQGSEYLSFAPYRAHLSGQLGLDRPLPASLVSSLGRKVREPIDSGLPWRPSLVLTGLRRAVGWPPVLCWLAVVAPGAVLASWRRWRPCSQAAILLVATTTWIYATSVFTLSLELVPRYLLPLVPLAGALVACAVEAALRRTTSPRIAVDSAREFAHR